MTPLRAAILAAVLAASPLGDAYAEDPAPPANAQYLQRADQRFGDFAGSSTNLNSMVTGLRAGTPFTLTDASGTVRIATPTRPMGYGNITRALDFASRELAAQGIKDPTPAEIQAALTGGTVNGVNGPVTLQGVLTLRSSGMGWGQVAHAIGVHPGLGAPAQARFAATPIASPAPHAPSPSGITTAAGTTTAVSASQGHGRAQVAGASQVSGITTGSGTATAAGVTTAAGGASNAGNGAGKGQGNAFGRGGR
jgi:hypothetical protein